MLKAEWAELSGRPDTVIFHDELSETNQPFYFSEFIERASNCGLRYLAEANFHEMQDFSFPDPVRQILQRCGDDIIAREQLMDFARGRRFRQTLLCRQDAAPQRHVDPAVVDSFFIGSPAAPTSDHPDISGHAIEEFHNPRGLSLEIDYPVGKAALLHLGRIWPALATLPELWAEVRALVGQPVDPTGLRAFLLKSYASDMVEFHLHRPRVSPVAGSHPMASPLSRLQASQGATVTTLNYTRIKISDPLSRFVITLLDGTRDRAELGKELVTFIEHLPQPDEAQAAARGQLLERLPEMLEQCLDSLAYTGLLVATMPE